MFLHLLYLIVHYIYHYIAYFFYCPAQYFIITEMIVYWYVCTVKFTQVSGHTSEGGNVVWAVSRYGLPIAELDWHPLLSVPPFDIHGVNFRSYSLPSAAGIFAQLL